MDDRFDRRIVRSPLPCLLAALLLSCRSDPAAAPSSMQASGASPLEEFCRDHPCTYDGYRARVGAWKPCPHGEAGTCGELRYVEIDAADGMERVYFGRAGVAIGAVTASDMGTSGAYGVVPVCHREPTEILCGR